MINNFLTLTEPSGDASDTESFKVAFYIGSFAVHWYGLFYFFAFFSCILYACLKAHFWKKVPYDPIFYYIFIMIPVSIFGARAWDAMTEHDITSFKEFFGFDNDGKFVGLSGLAIQGGVIFALIAAMIWFPLQLKRPKYMIRSGPDTVKRISVWVYSDIVLPIVLLGQVFGRWGNFFNFELYGPVATSGLPWLKALMPGVWDHMHIIPQINGEGYFDPTMDPTTLRHPLFLYESFFNFVGLILITVCFEFIKWFKVGAFASFYLIWYGIVRISLEGLKSGYDTTPYFVVAGLFIFVGILIFLYAQFLNYPYLRNKKLFKMIREYISFKINAAYKYGVSLMNKDDPLLNFKKNTNNNDEDNEEEFLYKKGSIKAFYFNEKYIKDDMYFCNR